MDIKLSQQVPATYARNHFKEVNDRAIEEGMCVIVRKSKPVTVLISIEEFEKLQKSKKKKPKKKITLEELRKNSVFKKYKGCVEKAFGDISSTELTKNWANYVD